ncbi:STAS domain-containing protein [Micromonospora sp. NPDC050495]|uniref:STAS domain-containing protein n=1 Tax=Micromonospora sp. NPDC050495 TaxID=3154936 RepID=UPI0034051462
MTGAGAPTTAYGHLCLAFHDPAVLDRADPRPVDGRLLVDATGLRFVDHRSLLHLRDHARRHGATAVLRASRAGTARLAELLGLAEVTVEVAR